MRQASTGVRRRRDRVGPPTAGSRIRPESRTRWSAGEIVEGDVAGDHYYPGRDRVLTWIAAEGLEVVTEEYQHARDAWGYRHFMLRSPG